MKLNIALQLIACCLLAHIPGEEAFLFKKKADCSVSSWSEWSAPFGFGTVIRKRVILKHPVQGGKDCPSLNETKSTSFKPTIKDTATSMKNHFIRRQEQGLNGLNGNKPTIKETAASMKNHFIRRQEQGLNGLNGNKPTIKDSATSMKNHFIRRQGPRLNGLNGNKPTIKDTAASMKNHFIRRQEQGLNGLNGKSVGLKRDLLVIIDSSGSIRSSRFTIVKDQIARLLGLLCPSPDPFSNNIQRAALIEYSTNAKVIFDFDDNSFTSQVQADIKNMPYMGQSTCTATAFRLAQGLFTPARGMRTDPDVKQEVLILTDGQSNCGGNAILEAHNLQGKADVFGLVIGDTFSTAGQNELSAYVSGPIDQHLFAIKGFQDLKLLLDEVTSQLNQPGTPPCVPFDI